MKIHLRSALDSIRRSPFQAASAIFVLSLTFFTATIFAVLIYGSSRVLSYFETRPQIIAFLRTDATDGDIANLQHKIEADSRVREIKYVSKDEALAIYKKATSSNPQLGELVNNSIFPASLEFSVKDLSFTKDVIEEVRGEPIIDSVGFTAAIGDETNLNSVVSKLKSISTYIRVGGISLVAILAFVSFIVLLTIISMRLASRKEEISILSLIGATQKFIRSPIIIEAQIYALLGVFLGSLISFSLVLYTAPSVAGFFGEITFFPSGIVEIGKLFGIILGIEILTALLIAYMGGFLAVRRAKKVR